MQDVHHGKSGKTSIKDTVMKILVTGSDGYIGSLLAPFLVERGHDVVGLDSGYYRNGWLYNNGFHRFPPTISEDIRNLQESDLEGYDAVVHMAELSNDPLGQLNPGITYDINHQGSVDLAKKCKAAGISRFVYTSSCSVYGAGSDDWKTEESAPNPQTAYAECKVLVERDVKELADDERFSPTFLRNATAYGPSPRMRFDVVLNNLAGLAWTTKQIKLLSDGSPLRPLVHVLDICAAIANVLESPRQRVHNQIFNVGSTQANYRVREIADVVARSFPGCSLSIGNSDGDNRSYRVSFDKIKDVLGFECQYDIEDGAAQLRYVFERIGMTPDVFNYPAFTRLHQLQHLISTGQLNDNLFWTHPTQKLLRRAA
jgi:nucleoside-diphosphate-sugar epimerase